MAQMPTLAKWGAYLQQCSTLSTTPLNGELLCLLGPETYTCAKQEEFAFEPLIAKCPYQEGKAPIPEDTWYPNCSSLRQPLKWRAVSFHPKTETVWMEDGEGNSSQWGDVWAVWLVISQEHSPIVVCTDSWVIYQC